MSTRIQEKEQRVPSLSPPASSSLLYHQAANETALIQMPPIVQGVVRSGGQKIDSKVRSAMERHFGYNFSQVKVHTDAAAAASAQAVDAQAYTVGQDVVFGAGRYAPETIEGKRLIAHELTHVMQQHKQGGSRLWRQEKSKEQPKSVDPELDISLILGSSKTKAQSVTDVEKLTQLYRYCKQIRNDRPELELIAKEVLMRHLPTQANAIWEESKKPLAGYIGTGQGALAGGFVRQATNSGLKANQNPTDSLEKRFLGSDIIFITGHHYGGGFFDLTTPEVWSLDNLKIRAERVKLVVIYSCSVLELNHRQAWAARFPNAYILGWRSQSPEGVAWHRQATDKFLAKLPENLLLERGRDMDEVVNIWRSYIEEMAKNRQITAERKMGYIAPGGNLAYYECDEAGQWRWVEGSSKQ